MQLCTQVVKVAETLPANKFRIWDPAVFGSILTRVRSLRGSTQPNCYETHILTRACCNYARNRHLLLRLIFFQLLRPMVGGRSHVTISPATLETPPFWPLIMAALRGRCGHFFYFCPVVSSFLVPCLISAVADWMSAILPHMVWP